MKPIGIDLAKLIAGEALPPDLVPDCPGARLRVLRSDYDKLTQGGERIRTPRQDIPAEAYGDARIACGNPVAELANTASGARQFYGLCHSCSGLEADNRATLRERAALKGDR